MNDPFTKFRKKTLPGNTKFTDDELQYWMQELNGNRTHVAERLGVTYKTVWQRCKKLETHSK
jgi:transcriptional regulator with AAA-type ATPase domain